MFGFLKKKLQEGIESIKKKIEGKKEPEEVKVQELEQIPEDKEKKELRVKKVNESEIKEIKKEIKAIKEEPVKAKDEVGKAISKEKTSEVKKELKELDEKKVKIKEPLLGKKVAEVKPVEQPKVLTKVDVADKEKGKKFGISEPVKEEKQEAKKEPEKKKGFFEKIVETVTTQQISEDKFEELFWELEIAMLENNVAVEVIDKIKADLKKELVQRPLQRGKVAEVIQKSLKNSVEELFIEGEDLIKCINAKKEKPFVIAFVGINGSGKTTSIAKIAHLLMKNKKKVVLAAADTFRAAAIQQLEEHANKLGVKIIKHDYGSDPAAVAFDAIKHAKSTGKDVVLIDTAGRLHSNTNLIEEMKKISRVANPDMKIFVGESIAGNDSVEQAKEFNNAIGIDGIILSKADIDDKGGAAVSVSYVTKKPILYLGTGQEYDDLIRFDSKVVVEGLGL